MNCSRGYSGILSDGYIRFKAEGDITARLTGTFAERMATFN